MKNTFLCFKGNVTNKITNIKTKPRSKRKSLVLGFTTVLGIFGVTLLAPILPAVAKDVPKNAPKPAPTKKPARVPSQEILKGI